MRRLTSSTNYKNGLWFILNWRRRKITSIQKKTYAKTNWITILHVPSRWSINTSWLKRKMNDSCGKATVENPDYKFSTTYEISWDVVLRSVVSSAAKVTECTSHLIVQYHLILYKYRSTKFFTKRRLTKRCYFIQCYFLKYIWTDTFTPSFTYNNERPTINCV